MEIIKLYSRHKDARFIEQISNTEYLVYGKSEWVKIAMNGDYVDFEEGPSLIVGAVIPTTSIKIKKINRVGNKGDMMCFKLTV